MKLVTVDIDQFTIVNKLNILSYSKASDFKTLSFKISYHYNYIPREIYNMINLNLLNWFNFRVKEISKNIQNLKNLNSLSLQSLDIISLPKSILYLRNIKYAYISKNKLCYYYHFLSYNQFYYIMTREFVLTD